MALEPMKITVLMGGSSFEREFSLQSGRNVTRALEAAGHTVLPLDTTSGLVETLRSQKPDVVYIALHGKNGEDGTIQSLLEFLDIPFVGSSSHVCRQAWNKLALPHVLSMHRSCKHEKAAILSDISPDKEEDKVSRGVLEADVHWPARINLAAVTVKDMGAATALDLVASRMPSGFPVAVKPARGGSALGITKVESLEGLAGAMLEAYSFDTDAIIEQWITGAELAVCVIGTGDDAQVLPPIEIVPKQGFFDVEHRLEAEMVDYYCPVRPSSLSKDLGLAQEAYAAIESVALEVHLAFGCRDLSRVDMFWDGSKPVVLELKVSPGMTERSLFPMACEATKMTFTQMLEGMLQAAVDR